MYEQARELVEGDLPDGLFKGVPFLLKDFLMSYAGRYADEATLFRLAGQLEKARPWADRLPPVYAMVSD